MNVKFLFLLTLRKGRRWRRIEFLAVSLVSWWQVRRGRPSGGREAILSTSTGCPDVDSLPSCRVCTPRVCQSRVAFAGSQRGKASWGGAHTFSHSEKGKRASTLQLSALEMSKIRSFFFIMSEHLPHLPDVVREFTLWFKTDNNVICAWRTWQKGRTQPSPSGFFFNSPVLLGIH